MYRQGDVLLIPVQIRTNLKSEKVRRVAKVTLALGEQTGHAHVLEGDMEVWDADYPADRRVSLLRLKPPETLTPGAIRFVELLRQGCLRHEEHGAITIPAGMYEIRRQRVYEAPDRVAWVAD